MASKTVDHSQDHVEHPAKYDQVTGDYQHSASLSEHLGQDVALLKDKMAEAGNKGMRVVKNLVGEGEREDLFDK